MKAGNGIHPSTQIRAQALEFSSSVPNVHVTLKNYRILQLVEPVQPLHIATGLKTDEKILKINKK